MANAKKPQRSALPSCLDTMRQGIQPIEAKLIELIECSTVEVFENDPYSELVFIGFPRYYWGKPDDKQLHLQMELKKLYGDWIEQLRLLLSDATEALRSQVDAVDSFMRRWIEKESSGDILPSSEENKTSLRNKLAVFHATLTALDDPAQSRVVLVPDTNALIKCPDPDEYGAAAGAASFDFVLLPTVLGELDDLKNKHRDEAFRDKVEAVIRRIKGWRTQGSLLGGVTVGKSVTVRTVAREPNFQKTLHWLDKENRDDRIIASVLELQRWTPSAATVLVTGDINLQNKASAASVPWAESPAAKVVPPKPWEGVLLEEGGEPRYFDWGRRMLAVDVEDAPFRMTEEFQQKVCELLWQKDDVSPSFTHQTQELKHWVYETDRARKWKRKLRAHFDTQYLVADPRREAAPPKCPECGRRCSRGANYCSHCMKAGKTVKL